MSDLLSKIKAGTSNHKLIKWPGSDQTVAIKILSQKDLQDAAFQTERLFKTEKIEVSIVTAEDYEVEKSIQILYKSLRDPANLDEAIAPNIAEFRKALTREERRILTDEYLGFESEVSPQIDKMSKEEFDRLVEQLKKTPDQILSSITSTETLKRLLRFMASQPVSLPKRK